MLFWTSFLVFLASVLIYMLLPARTDQIALDHYRDDPLIISFVDQHQAAKDYAEQMIMWKDDADTLVHPFDTEKLAKFMPQMMQTENDTTGQPYHDIGKQIDIDNDKYVSGMICLDKGNNDELAKCSDETDNYVITYGYVPNWWNEHNMHRQGSRYKGDDPILVIDNVWLKPMLRRTHGSDVCGVLTYRGTAKTAVKGGGSKDISIYTIDNGQTRKGFRSRLSTGEKILPLTVGQPLDETLLPDDSRPALLCMTPYQNPYVQTPVFHWDYSNNSAGHGHKNIGTTDYGDALVGSLEGRTIKCEGIETCSISGDYTLSGVVKKDTTTGNLMGDDFPVTYTCGGVDGTCTLSIGDVSVSQIPKERGFAFTYIGNTSETGGFQKLDVFYCPNVVKTETIGGETVTTTSCQMDQLAWKDTAKNTQATSTTKAPVLNNLLLNNMGLTDVLIYDKSLSDKDVIKNNKANHKRFGI